MSEAGEPNRWTCEACGCHTNVEADRNCGICGTSRSGSNLLRRRAPWLHHHRAMAGMPPGGAPDDDDDDEDDDVDDFLHHMNHPPPPHAADLWDMDDAESAIESLAMEVASSRGRMIESRERFLEAARNFGQRRDARQGAFAAGTVRTRSETAAAAASQELTVPQLSAPEMLTMAQSSSASYQPRWLRQSQAYSTRGGGAAAVPSLLDIGQGDQQNLAYVPFGAGEGRAIRAEAALPRNDVGASLSETEATDNNISSEEPPQRNIFGFRVAFDHPNCEQGGNMGGGYLVGVTTRAFSSYTDHNGLQHTPFFWGIEDGAKKFEGSRRAQWTLGDRAYRGRVTASSNPLQQAASSSLYATQLGPQDVPMNAHGVLFGSREVVTVICDLDNRVMTFWRDSTLLGTLVTSLPRTGELFPVAVPYHHGSMVAITSLDVTPVPLLVAFAAERKQAQRKKDEELHRKLLVDRGVLINKGKMTDTLRSTLVDIFIQYSKQSSSTDLDNDHVVLAFTEAARLWYRCGLKLSLLSDGQTVNLNDFLAIFEKVCAEDEARSIKILPERVDIKVGDFVELVEDYDKFGDALGGPLQPLERGMVVDLQNGADGERKSVRVLHNQRRWWYQPSAILPESSGLIETPAVFFIRRVLRAHGYHHGTLTQLSLKTFRVNACQLGDIVKPRKTKTTISNPVFGRIAAENLSISDSFASRGRGDHAGVLVEFADRHFAEATGLNIPNATSASASTIETRRVRHSKLAFCSMADIVAGCLGSEVITCIDDEGEEESETLCHRLQSELTALSRLDGSAMQVIARECRKSATLAALFSAGLPDAMMSAIDVAERQMNSLEPREDLPEKIDLLGNLILVISKRLFSGAGDVADTLDDDMDDDELDDRQSLPLPVRRPGMRVVDTTGHGVSVFQDRHAGVESVNASSNALQQRRSMLLTLMNRARRGNQGFIFGDADSEGLFGGEFSLHDVVPPFAFGHSQLDQASAGATDFFGGASPESNSPVNRSADDRYSQIGDMQPSKSYLNDILRCRAEKFGKLSLKAGGDGAATVVFTRQLVGLGILVNDLVWIQASVESHGKRAHPGLAQTNVLRHCVDEEGTPVLLLAVSFGCSLDVLNYLINKGVQVTSMEIDKAARTGQSSSLSLLLQHASSPEITEESYPADILEVFAKAKERQQGLQDKMRGKAGSFIISLAQRLIRFGLASHRRTSHRRTSPRVDLCTRALAEVLVGNVLLSSQRRAQQTHDVESKAETSSDPSIQAADGGGGIDILTDGLLGSFPLDILGATILSGSQHLRLYLALVDDFLCRKDLVDVSAGMSMLYVLLNSFPVVIGCSELRRFGVAEKVSLHLDKVSKRVDETAKGSSAPSHLQPIRCPKKHIAVIHVTRHNSFRCDICGSGVDRGRPMYGCRECDWDACENCTDKFNSGAVKCASIKRIASECLRLLTDNPSNQVNDADYANTLKELEEDDNTDSLRILLKRLVDRDVLAVQRLGEMLLATGRVTIHQFQSLVLPTLFSCLSGHGQGQDETRLGPARRTKRARVIDDQLIPSPDYSPEERIRFANQIVSVLFTGSVKCRSAIASTSDGHVNGIFTEETDQSYMKSDYEFTCSDEAQEVLRRCHQLLSFHEDLSHIDNSFSLNGTDHGELSSLTKSITIQLTPLPSETVGDSTRSLMVHTQPLVHVAKLQAIVLQASRVRDISYVAFARQLAEDHAIIVERACSLDDKQWRIAAVLSFDEDAGTHVLLYASGWRGDSSRPMEVSMSSPLDIDSLVFKNEAEKAGQVSLAASSYYVLSRPGHQFVSSHGPFPLPPTVTVPESRLDSSQRNAHASSTLVRTWSALSLADAMRPAELKVQQDLCHTSDDADIMFLVRIGEGTTRLVCEKIAIGVPPVVSVSFSPSAKVQGRDFKESDETTLLSALHQLLRLNGKSLPLEKEKPCELFYSIAIDEETVHRANACNIPSRANTSQSAADNTLVIGQCMSENRSRKLSSLDTRSLSAEAEDEDSGVELCDGLEATALHCMRVIDLLRVYTQDSSDSTRNESYESLFVNATMSKRLSDQLDVPLPVVCKALPSWCIAAPAFAPSIFSHEARRTLLQRAAFGVSRCAFKQQEAKVNVGRLRQRMHALRARAVELIGQAFSGGAEDPTALQLQADELYGMEEALASRVRAAFKAAKWQEHSLQVAKASIRREHLLTDATAIMQLYATDKTVFHRRLEIRFDGESGFDLASGTEAGVTRGFYADVAECLLSTEYIDGLHGPNTCSDSSLIHKTDMSEFVQMDLDLPEQMQQLKLPLWIPDLDSSGSVVIPTPRADEKGRVGVFPRPLPSYHPMMPEILQRFRFIGRLFAAATRDGFVFPLPISPAFLKLVLQGEAAPALGKSVTSVMVLTSQDLPRAGFLGGDVYAAENFICRALDAVDTANPPLSRFEQEKRYKEIASDVGFARIAFGRSYDCSFEDYFQDRTFVDPLDTAQDDSAAPLCTKGYEKRVTIYNVREYVALAKRFMLYDGIHMQADAFRQGIEDFFPMEYLKVFTAEELHRDICGGGDGVDKWNESAVRKLFKLDGGKDAAEALVAVAAIGGESGSSMSRRFGPTSPTIGFLIKALLEATSQQRRQFLSFVTSVPIETPGRIEVVPIVSPNGEFLPINDPGCLPRANTCARRIYLPKFASYDNGNESFKEVFWAVVREESKFKGFYEWRG